MLVGLFKSKQSNIDGVNMLRFLHNLFLIPCSKFALKLDMFSIVVLINSLYVCNVENMHVKKNGQVYSTCLLFRHKILKLSINCDGLVCMSIIWAQH
jgi:hypothetical protein